MRRTMGRKTIYALLIVWAIIGGLVSVIAAPFTPAGAEATRITTSRDVTTKMRCRANAPIVGWVDADQDVSINVTGPNYVKQGDTFDVIVAAGDTNVPTDSGGIAINNLHDIYTRNVFMGGSTLQSVSLVPGTGSYKPTPTSAPQAIPGAVTVTKEGTDKVVLYMAGPFGPNSVLTPPKVKATIVADGPVGSKISSKFAGAIPTNISQVFPDWGFKVTPNVQAPLVGASDASATCAPNYGSLANANGETTGTTPLLGETTILPNTDPLVNIAAPVSGGKYLPDDVVNADFECVETVYALTSCDATQADGTPLDFSQLGVHTFTVTATDANGGVTTKTVSYSSGANVVPTVNAGPDQTVNGGTTVALAGSATDPDTGQTLSYQWTQVSGTPVTLNPDEANDPFETNAHFTARAPRAISSSASAPTTASTPARTRSRST